jgi:negative regulator of flagellin synthesis FlgM
MKVNNTPAGRPDSAASTKSTGAAKGKSKAEGSLGAAAGSLGAASTSGSQPLGGARVELSPRAREAQKAREIATGGPDVDEAKIAKYQKLIDSGNYKVDAKAVADRLVEEHLSSSAFRDDE